ncbi:MAG: amidohydrolase family protein [Candidatus Kariarchaeaceae archaeon]|jgi:predicted TIM-barrel fold metal-dependent hydrolase
MCTSDFFIFHYYYCIVERKQVEFDYYIDAHIHFHSPEMTKDEIKQLILREFPALRSFFKNPNDNSTLLGMMDALNCKQAWIINYESPDVMGYTIETNDWVSQFCEDTDGRLVAIGGINPTIHEDAAEIMRDYFDSGLLRGLKVHGPHQLVWPNAYIDGLGSQRKLYEMVQELQIPVIFHTVTSIFPKARSKYGHPLLLEDVLIDFPDLVAILAHGGRPSWTREAEYLMAKFPKLYLDLSGIPPHLIAEYFPRFHRYAERAIFGSDFPSPGVPSLRVNAEAIANLPLPDETISKILFENAEKLIPN